jgi:hypothetical protein
VVAFAEHRYVPGLGLAAPGPVDGVIVLAHPGGASASGEPAMHVPRLQVPVHRRGDAVGIRGEDESGDRVGEDAVPDPVRSGEHGAGGVGVDRGQPVDRGAAVGGAGGGEGGDGDLNGCADRAEAAAGRVDGGLAGQDQVGEQIGTGLVDGAGVFYRLSVGFARFVSLRSLYYPGTLVKRLRGGRFPMAVWSRMRL